MQAFLVDSGDHTAVSTVRSVEFVGNRTECALLLMLRGWGHDYKGIRDAHRDAVQKVYTFSSATKMATVLISTGEDSYRLYVKVSLKSVTRLSGAAFISTGHQVHSQGLSADSVHLKFCHQDGQCAHLR